MSKIYCVQRDLKLNAVSVSASTLNFSVCKILSRKNSLRCHHCGSDRILMYDSRKFVQMVSANAFKIFGEFCVPRKSSAVIVYALLRRLPILRFHVSLLLLRLLSFSNHTFSSFSSNLLRCRRSIQPLSFSPINVASQNRSTSALDLNFISQIGNCRCGRILASSTSTSSRKSTGLSTNSPSMSALISAIARNAFSEGSCPSTMLIRHSTHFHLLFHSSPKYNKWLR